MAGAPSDRKLLTSWTPHSIRDASRQHLLPPDKRHRRGPIRGAGAPPPDTRGRGGRATLLGPPPRTRADVGKATARRETPVRSPDRRIQDHRATPALNPLRKAGRQTFPLPPQKGRWRCLLRRHNTWGQETRQTRRHVRAPCAP